MNLYFGLSLLALYILFLRWYGGNGRPLSASEIESYMKRLSKEQAASLRPFAEEDDGRAFHNVNLVKYRKKPIYEDGRSFMGSSRDANSIYGREVIPQLIKRASHPILLSSTLGVLNPGSGKAKDWERINIVRYRSRRDLLDMVASQSWQASSAHKNAAVEVTEIYPVTGASTNIAKVLVGMALAFIGLLATLL